MDPLCDVEFQLNETDLHSPPEQLQVSLLIVFDTSFLVENISFLQDLDLVAFPHQFVRIVIPWKVVKELESLCATGGKSRSCSLRANAKDCSRVLMQLVNARESVVIGQRLDETFLNLNQSVHSSDDLILDCCEFFRRVYEKRVSAGRSDPLQIAILTNDRNLALKASIHHIKAIVEWKRSAKELLEDICQSDLMVLDEESVRNCDSVAVTEDSSLQVLAIDPAVEFNLYSQHLVGFCGAIVQILSPLLEELLESLLGSHWSCVLPAKPWKLVNVLQIAHDNWNCLFRETLPLELRNDIWEMMQFIGRFYTQQVQVKKNRLPSREEFERFQQKALKLVRLLGGMRLSACKSPNIKAQGK